MIINGINIKSIGCHLLRYRYTPSQYNGRSFWDNGVIYPIILEGSYGWSNLEIDIYIEDESAAGVERKKSQLNALMENPLIILDEVDSEIEYICAYENQVVVEKINEVASIATYNFKAVKRGIEKSIPLNNLSNVITIEGTAMADATYEVTPKSDLIDFTINDVILKNLTANKTVIVDGLNKTVTVDGVNKFKDTDFLSFPKFKPGSHTISLNRTNVTVIMKYHPRYA